MKTQIDLTLRNLLSFPLSLFLALTLWQCDEYDDDRSYNYFDEIGTNYRNGDDSDGDQYEDYGENPFVLASEHPTSTFGVDADGGSYSNMRRYFSNRMQPPTSAVRIEEFINYFNYNYPDPKTGHVSMNTEYFSCPWETEHYLLRIGLKGQSLDENPASNFVFLIDVSGSMSSSDKLDLLKKGFLKYTDQLSETDKVAIVTYAGSSGVVLQSTYGDEKTAIKNAINGLGAGGSTAGADGIRTAYEIAVENYIPGGNNRVILGTDGDFNVGISSTDALVELIEEKRESNVFLTVLGVGSGNLNDAMMEQLANNGNGNYEYIDNTEQLMKVFVYEYDKFFTVAKDCKIQVEFNAEAVEQYRLIGYENRVMENEDYENDSVDSGEIGASQTITALYEIIPNNASANKLANINFRYKKPLADESHEFDLSVSNSAVPFNSASENSRFASSVAGLGLVLKESEYKGNLTLDMVYNWGRSANSYDPYGFRAEFLDIVSLYME